MLAETYVKMDLLPKDFVGQKREAAHLLPTFLVLLFCGFLSFLNLDEIMDRM